MGRTKPDINPVLAALAVLTAVPAVARGDLLINGSFEESGHDGPAAWESRLYGHAARMDFEVHLEGKASLRLASTGRPQASSLRQEFPAALVRQRAYRFEGEVKTENVQKSASLFVIVNETNQRRFIDYMRDREVSGSSDWTHLELVVPRFPDAESVSVGLLFDGAGVAWFDNLRIAPVVSADPLSRAAADYVEEALNIMEENSIRRQLVDWSFVRAQAIMVASGAETTRDAYPAIDYALYMIADDHSRLYRPEYASEVRTGDSASDSLPGWTPPSGVRLSEDVSYLTVPPVTGTSRERTTRYADEMQSLIAELDSAKTCGWIVDLRGNHGGNVFPMLAGIGPILGEGDAGGGITAAGETIPRSYRDGRSGNASLSGAPYFLANPLPPVAVLIGPATGSSGEAVALAFVGRMNTRTFGQPTGGLTTGNAPFRLSDGAVLNLAVTQMIDRNGNVYGDKILPDMNVPGEYSEDPYTDPVVGAALHWLSEECRERQSAAGQRNEQHHGRTAH